MTYRLISYRADSESRAGIVLGDLAYDLAAISGRADYDNIAAVLADWSAAKDMLAGLSVPDGASGLSLDEVELLPAVHYPGAIFCAGANYRDHAENMARIHNLPPPQDPHELGILPWHFLKTSRCAIGHRAPVVLNSAFLDWEAELAIVIGKEARNVSIDNAMDHVAAYTIANDLSARDRLQQSALPEASPFKYDWIGHKVFDGSCPLGPWLVPADAIADPQDLSIKTWVNDVIKQDSTTRHMIFTIAEQIARLSLLVTLYPGDVILTGTPAGVGSETGECLHRGDRVCIAIEGVGELVNDIV